MSVSVPAVVMAGDRGAARAIRGESKLYLEIRGRALVTHVVATLQLVPEVSEVWVIGDAARLHAALAPLRHELCKPLHVVSQFRNLYENAWEMYRRVLPGAGPEGRDPVNEEDHDLRALYLSADVPFATPQEIGAFVREAWAYDCDYAAGFVHEAAVKHFYPRAKGGPGIHPAYFNISEGRIRQSNLHLVRPGRIGNRYYVQEMYEHRYQKQFGNMLFLGWRIVRAEKGGLRIASYYLLMHLAAILDRCNFRRLADRVRSWLPTARIEHAMSLLFRASCRLVFTNCGGCAIDIDREAEYEAAVMRYDEWRETQDKRAESLYGPVPAQDGRSSA